MLCDTVIVCGPGIALWDKKRVKRLIRKASSFLGWTKESVDKVGETQSKLSSTMDSSS